MTYDAPEGPVNADAAPARETPPAAGLTHDGSTTTDSPGSKTPFWFEAPAACVSTTSSGASDGCQPIWTTSKSLAVSASKAGFRTSLSQRTSHVPLMTFGPLSARSGLRFHGPRFSGLGREPERYWPPSPHASHLKGPGY